MIRSFKRNPYFVNNIDDVWEMDLVDLKMYKNDNDQYAYLLTVIDVLTKYA